MHSELCTIIICILLICFCMGHHWVTILEANDVSVFPIMPIGQPEFESGLSPFSVRFGSGLSGLSGLVRIRVRSGFPGGTGPGLTGPDFLNRTRNPDQFSQVQHPSRLF